MSASDFGKSIILASKNECGSVPSLSISWKRLRRVVLGFL
jgi:hypothetical protein